ncbi:hypothetical protein [Serratia sp. KG1D]|uniref:hypothetical protein n=1 Tax=Serratia sp. KG1D TaxID=3120277 RepID=UPI003016D105
MANSENTPIPQEVITSKYKDSYIDDYASWANRGINMGLTISVSGIVYTGVLIGVNEWCDKMISQIEASNNTDEAKEAITSYYTQMKESFYSDIDEVNSNINFVHMKNVRIVTGDSISKVSSIWRFKIDEIDGFSVGVWQES